MLVEYLQDVVADILQFSLYLDPVRLNHLNLVVSSLPQYVKQTRLLMITQTGFQTKVVLKSILLYIV